MSYVEISNEFLKAKIRLFGAELASLTKTETEVEYIWQADPTVWQGSAPILFPFVGKLNQGQFLYQTQSFEIAKHGFARNQLFNLISQTANKVTLGLSQNDETLTTYPFEFYLEVTFELVKNKMFVSYQVTNNSNTDMPFSIGSHPAFNLPAETMEKAQCSLAFDAEENPECYTLIQGLLSESTQTSPIKNKCLPLTAGTFAKDALILRHINSKEVSLIDAHEKQLLTMRFDVPHLGLWAKPNAPYVCIEPWFSTDDKATSPLELEEKEDLINLASKAVFDCQYEIEIY